MYLNQRGFTLLEMMIVVVIMGILAGLIVPKMMGRPQQARLVKVKQDILSIQAALDLYQLDNGVYPTTEQGLDALVHKPVLQPFAENWNPEGYLQQLPLDPWGKPYRYVNENGHVSF